MSDEERPGLAYRCGQCGQQPRWTLSRIGDAVRSWACAEHLSAECDALQRDFETTELSVVRCWYEGLL